MFNYNELIVIVSGDNEDFAVEFLDRVKFIFDALPVWMKPQVLKRNETTLQFGVETTDKKTGETTVTGLNSSIKSLSLRPDSGLDLSDQ